MKGICVLKRLLFINILCLLWLPNFCDIKQNGAANQNLQTNKIVPSDVRAKNVPSMQEKEIIPEQLNVILKDTKPNVEYVNNLENKINKEDKENRESPQNHIPETSKQQIVTNLHSSRMVDETEPSLKQKPSSQTTKTHSDETTEKPELKIPSKLDSPIVLQPVTTPMKEGSYKHSQPTEDVKTSRNLESSEQLNEVKETVASPVPVKPVKTVTEDSLHQPHYDGMPSFDEWKKMMLAEQEKGGQKVPSPSPPGKKISSQKRRRNYSSYECGAKIVGSNAEAEGTSRILNELVDEYMLNPCKAKIWFVIELCETVQASQIELANFELFSSCPKDFAVYSSDNFPTRDWVPLGTFTAAEQRVLQSFALKQEGFGKFIKIELLSHYGTEHYCPLSVVRIFGTSMVDEYEEMETLSNQVHIQEDDLDRLDIIMEDKKSTNIFGSATDAVMNIVKKAAQALGHQELEDKKSNDTVPDQNVSEAHICSVVDQSQDKCKDVPKKSSLDEQSLHNFPIPSSSMHYSLFRLLHRCDQCVSSRIRYYSSAQPHCRFFLAALGPVVFQTLCDWFKEHPLVIPLETPSHRNKLPMPSIDSSPTKSPPPQILRVSVESDIPWNKLISNDTIPIGPVDVTVQTNATISLLNMSNTSVVDEIEIISTAQPTGSRQAIITTAYNESENIPSVSETSKSAVVMPDISEKSEIQPSVIIESETSTLSERTILESATATAGITDSSIISDVVIDSEVEKITDLFSDSITSSEDLPEVITTTEIPIDLKPSVDKPVDMQFEFQGKVEPVSASNIAGQKESVFMRLSNRIKALELNMSLSGQYLEELSRRYRRQMDEMQRAFNRTIGTLNDTARKATERDLKQQDTLANLQLQVANLTETVELLMTERSTIFRQMFEIHLCLMAIEAIVMITIMSLCVRRISSSAGPAPPAAKETVVVSSRISKRRSSVDSATPPVARKVKKRSASEEALNAGEGLIIIEPLPVLIDPMLKVKKKNKKRNKAIQRSNSNPTASRKNSNSASQNAADQSSRSDSYIHMNFKSRIQSHGSNSACENCNNNTCTLIRAPDKEKRPNGAPFQNLTNGSVIGPCEPKTDGKVNRGKEKFSFKKLLRFQKRDSI